MQDQVSSSKQNQTVAHVSDLHIGRSSHHTEMARMIAWSLSEVLPSVILVTGDITHHGKDEEFAQFEEIFGAFLKDGTMIVVPGNHDRLGDDIAKKIMGNDRLKIVEKPGMRIVALDSTAHWNQFLILGHGKIAPQTMNSVLHAVNEANPHDVVIVALHHHLLPHAEEKWIEKVATFFKTPIARELSAGEDFVGSLLGKTHLILHGHRHIPTATYLKKDARMLNIYNAGSTTVTGTYRLFRFDNGVCLGEPEWIRVA